MATKSSTRNGASQKSSGGKSQSSKKPGSSRSASMTHGRGSSSKSHKGNGSSSDSKASPEQGGQQGIVSKATAPIRDAGSKIYDTIRQHPIATSLVGAGITAGVAILAVRAIRGISDQQGEEDQQGDGDAQDQTDGGEAEGSAEGEEGQEGDEEGGEEEGEGDGDDEDDLCSRGKFWQRHPLAIGAGLMGLGAAAGMLLPATGIEKKLFGSASDKFADRFKSAGQKLLKQGKQMASKVVSETGSALSEEVEREGLSPDKLATKVSRIAGRLKDVVAHAVEE